MRVNALLNLPAFKELKKAAPHPQPTWQEVEEAMNTLFYLHADQLREVLAHAPVLVCERLMGWRPDLTVSITVLLNARQF